MPDVDFDLELEAALAETSDSGSECNEGRNDEPGTIAFWEGCQRRDTDMNFRKGGRIR